MTRGGGGGGRWHGGGARGGGVVPRTLYSGLAECAALHGPSP